MRVVLVQCLQTAHVCASGIHRIHVKCGIVQCHKASSLLCCCFCTTAGVAPFVEPNVPKPGTIQVPNPSAELLEPVPIAKVMISQLLEMLHCCTSQLNMHFIGCSDQQYF
jgi:hypothetical protein